jgi:uncharacterized protein (DUF433 family)
MVDQMEHPQGVEIDGLGRMGNVESISDDVTVKDFPGIDTEQMNAELRFYAMKLESLTEA